MFSVNLDLGQLLIAVLLASLTIVAWFIKKEITNFGKRLDKHEAVITDMTSTLSRVVGEVSIIIQFLGPKGRFHVRESDMKDNEG